MKKKNKTTVMETWNRLKVTRAAGGRGWWRKEGEGTRQRICMNDPQTCTECGNWLWKWGRDGWRRANRENWNNCNKITIKNQMLHQMELQKEQQIKLKVSRRKEIIKIWAEINGIESKRDNTKDQWSQELFLWNKTDWSLNRFIKKKE